MDKYESCGESLTYAKIIVFQQIEGLYLTFLNIRDLTDTGPVSDAADYIKQRGAKEGRTTYKILLKDKNVITKNAFVSNISQEEHSGYEISLNLTLNANELNMMKSSDIDAILVLNALIFMENFRSAATYSAMHKALETPIRSPRKESSQDMRSGQSVTIGGTIAEAVDLGLSVKWASHNVGVSKPEMLGNKYAWAEIETKKSFSYENYKYCEWRNNAWNFTLGQKDIAGTEYDVSTQKWGEAWQMPTKDQFKELLENCIMTKTSKSGVRGVLCRSKINGNSIFFPADIREKFGTDYWCSDAMNGWQPYNWWLNLRYDLHKGASSGNSALGGYVRPICK